MSHPLDGLMSTITTGDFSQHSELSNIDDLDLTCKVRRAYLAKILENGELPQAGTDEAVFLLNLLSAMERQVIDKERNNIANKKIDVGEQIREIMLAFPGRLGSAQELAKQIGGTPDETVVEIPADLSKLEGFEFKPSELNNEPHGLDLDKVKQIVTKYQQKIVEEASSANKTAEVGNLGKKSQNN